MSKEVAEARVVEAAVPQPKAPHMAEKGDEETAINHGPQVQVHMEPKDYACLYPNAE